MANLKVMVSKRMAKIIGKAVPKFNVRYVQLSVEEYESYVNYRCFENYEDYDSSTGMFKAICIEYPDDYYACDRFLTTKDLIRCLKRSSTTFDGFINEVKNEIMI